MARHVELKFLPNQTKCSLIRGAYVMSMPVTRKENLVLEEQGHDPVIPELPVSGTVFSSPKPVPPEMILEPPESEAPASDTL